MNYLTSHSWLPPGSHRLQDWRTLSKEAQGQRPTSAVGTWCGAHWGPRLGEAKADARSASGRCPHSSRLQKPLPVLESTGEAAVPLRAGRKPEVNSC